MGSTRIVGLSVAVTLLISATSCDEDATEPFGLGDVAVDSGLNLPPVDSGLSLPPLDAPPVASGDASLTESSTLPPQFGGLDSGTDRSDAGSDTPALLTGVLAGLETVVVETTLAFLAGGALTLDFKPVILFKDGAACRDMEFVVSGLDVEVHKAMYPKMWTGWKMIDGKVALQRDDKWIELDFATRYAPLTAGFVLEGAFTRVTGGGNSAPGIDTTPLGGVGGSVTIALQSQFRFTANGHFTHGSDDFIETSIPNIVQTDIRPDQHGTYRIDGYRIDFHYEDGKTSASSFVYDPAEPKALFLGGRSFTIDQ